MTRRILYPAAAAFGVVLLHFGLHPFDFRQRNRIDLSAREGLLRFQKPSLALVAPLPESLRRLAAGPLTIEVIASTSRYQSRSVPRIVSIHGADDRKILVIGQWKAGMVFRFYNGRTAKKSEFGISNAFGTSKPALITPRSRYSSSAMRRSACAAWTPAESPMGSSSKVRAAAAWRRCPFGPSGLRRSGCFDPRLDTPARRPLAFCDGASA